MKKTVSFDAGVVALLSIVLHISCSSDLGDPSQQSDAGTGGDGSGGDPVGTGGLGTGGVPAGTGSDAATGGETATGGSAPEVVYSPGFQTVIDVLSGFKIGRPDYSCASSDCHSGGSETTKVPLRLVQDESLYAELTTHVSVKCGNLKVVEPGMPQSSALLKVLKEGCSDNIVEPEKPIPRMPYDCVQNEFENSCVADEYIALIEQWIADGAPQF